MRPESWVSRAGPHVSEPGPVPAGSGGGTDRSTEVIKAGTERAEPSLQGLQNALFFFKLLADQSLMASAGGVAPAPQRSPRAAPDPDTLSPRLPAPQVPNGSTVT